MKKVDICKLICWNSRGLSASIPYLRSLIERGDIICISEHWLFENNLRKLKDIALNVNYVARSSEQSNAEAYGSHRGQGGVAIIWSQALTRVTPIDDIVHDRVCGVRFQSDSGQVVNILSVYMPSRGCEGDLSLSLDELGGIIDAQESGTLTLVCGDMNGDLGKLGGPKGLKNPDKRGRAIYSFMENYDLIAANLQVNSTGPVNTFNGPFGDSCLDYFLVPNAIKGDIVKCMTLEREALNTSDHVPIYLEMNLGLLDKQYIEVEAPKRLKWDRLSEHDLFYMYTTPVGEKLRKLEDTLDSEPPNNLLIDGCFDTICNILIQGEVCIPTTKFKQNLKPYWCTELDALKAEKVKRYAIWSRAGKPRGRSSKLWSDHSQSEKAFRKKLKQLSKLYDDERIAEASLSAEIDKNIFWKLLKSTKKNSGAKVLAIKTEEDKVVYDVESVLETWRRHFVKLSTPTNHPWYDQGHFEHVVSNVEIWAQQVDEDPFLIAPFAVREIEKGISQLNTGKVPGHDTITAEHVLAAGKNLATIMTKLFNIIVAIEYIPSNFRKGIQIPLYKGKNTSSIDPNNYRGITLLSTFNKLFEIVLWNRIKHWWYENQIISSLQGAARPGISCLHTALLLQETVAANLEHHKKLFVSYYDVSKAFDGVWVKGLFYQLRQLGLKGKIWRLLYLTYQNFKCRVRIQGRMSGWYVMGCGIHQGGYLSLVKYVAFINSLIVELSQSKLCCAISGLQTTPPGYADDLATACISKDRLDRVMEIVSKHGSKWRYQFNASKSAVLVYGERPAETKNNSRYRTFNLRGKQVKELPSYDHVGVKCTILNNSIERTTERISKGRKAFNAASSIGIKRNGLSTSACNLIFWNMIIPIVTYGAELWVMGNKDIELLDAFQRYAARRIQRFGKRTPNETSLSTLGWMRIESYIYGKKMLFVRTITSLNHDNLYRQVFVERLKQFHMDMASGLRNTYKSPIFDILRISIVLNLYDEIKGMALSGHIYGKQVWKRLVWGRINEIESEDWAYSVKYFDNTSLLRSIVGTPSYSIWWTLSDSRRDMMAVSETMAKLISRASCLKSDHYEFRDKSIIERSCNRCDNCAEESVFHLVMQCQSVSQMRDGMYAEIRNNVQMGYDKLIESPQDTFKILLGKPIDDLEYPEMQKLWSISGRWIHRMYQDTLNDRKGIG